jgi:hypothetical protein
MCFTGGELSVGTGGEVFFTLFLCVTRRLLESCGFNYGDGLLLFLTRCHPVTAALIMNQEYCQQGNKISK